MSNDNLTHPDILRAERFGSPVDEPELIKCRQCGEEIETCEKCAGCDYSGCKHCMVYDDDIMEFFCGDECREAFYEKETKDELSRCLTAIKEARSLKNKMTVCLKGIKEADSLWLQQLLWKEYYRLKDLVA